MRRAWISYALATAALAGGAHAERAAAPTPATPAVVDALTGIDFAAQKPTLDTLLAPAPVPTLTSLATDHDLDPAVRLRALRALALYPTPEARATLTATIHDTSTASAGTPVLELRAAIEALGLIRNPDDVAAVVPLLDKDDSRDVRAAAARALRDIGAATAIAPLRARLARETVPQVQFAISDALRVLSGTSP